MHTAGWLLEQTIIGITFPRSLIETAGSTASCAAGTGFIFGALRKKVMAAWPLLLVVAIIPWVVLGSCLGDPTMPGWKGRLSTFMNVTTPTAIYDTIEYVFGARTAESLADFVDWVMNKPNPLLQVLYHLILGACLFAWVQYGEPRLENGGTYFVKTYPKGWHHWSEAYIGVTACILTWCLANGKGPGRITKLNVACFDHNLYDGLMFHEENECRTCNVKKPARSKHCRYCGFCVPVYDHHCIWLNQCVGEHNYRWFLLFLITHAVVFLYFAYMLFYITISPIYEHKLWRVPMASTIDGSRLPSWRVVWYFLLRDQGIMILLILTATLFGLTLTAFLIYHLNLLRNGFTTNETTKWEQCLRLHGYVVECYNRYIELEASATEYETETQHTEKIRNSTTSSSNSRSNSGSSSSSSAMIDLKNDDATVECIPATTATTATTAATCASATSPEKRDEEQVEQNEKEGQEEQDKLSREEECLYEASRTGLAPFQILREFISYESDNMPRYSKTHPGEFPSTSPYSVGMWGCLKRVIFPPSLYGNTAGRGVVAADAVVGPGNYAGDDDNADDNDDAASTTNNNKGSSITSNKIRHTSEINQQESKRLTTKKAKKKQQ